MHPPLESANHPGETERAANPGHRTEARPTPQSPQGGPPLTGSTRAPLVGRRFRPQRWTLSRHSRDCHISSGWGLDKEGQVPWHASDRTPPEACPLARRTRRLPAVTPSPTDRPPLSEPHRPAVVHRSRCLAGPKTSRPYPRAGGGWSGQPSSGLWVSPGRGDESLLPHRGVPSPGARAAGRSGPERRRCTTAFLRARVLGVDGGGASPRGSWGCGDGGGLPLAGRAVAETDPRAVASARPLARALEVDAVVAAAREGVEILGRGPQGCTFPLRRWAGRALFRLRSQVPAAWQAVVEEAWAVRRARPPRGEEALGPLSAGDGAEEEEPVGEWARVLRRGADTPRTGGCPGCLPHHPDGAGPGAGPGGQDLGGGGGVSPPPGGCEAGGPRRNSQEAQESPFWRASIVAASGFSSSTTW